MPDAHALLSPSAAHRWMACPASIDMASRVTELPSAYAEEGTRAHVIAELRAADHFQLIDDEEYAARYLQWEVLGTEQGDDLEEMVKYADLYVELLQSIVDKYGGTVQLEQRLDTGVPHCWGTGDAVVISPGRITVVDLKYGAGVWVEAEENPQLMLYGVGALDTFDLIGDVTEVEVIVFQPRMGNTSRYAVGAAELRRWRDEEVVPKAHEAMSDHPRFGPGDDTCRWCPAAGECKPRMLHITRRDFGDPDLMTPDELSEALSQIEDIRDWCSAVEALSLSKVYNDGVKLPGWKVVLSGGRRSIPDVEAAVQVLVDAGYDAEQVVRLGIRPFYELEKTVGKTELTELLGSLIVASEGKPSLVPESDKRPALDRITEDFG